MPNFDAGDLCYSVGFQERKDLLKRLSNKGVGPGGDTSIPPVPEVYEALNTPQPICRIWRKLMH